MYPIFKPQIKLLYLNHIEYNSGSRAEHIVLFSVQKQRGSDDRYFKNRKQIHGGQVWGVQTSSYHEVLRQEILCVLVKQECWLHCSVNRQQKKWRQAMLLVSQISIYCFRKISKESNIDKSTNRASCIFSKRHSSPQIMKCISS